MCVNQDSWADDPGWKGPEKKSSFTQQLQECGCTGWPRRLTLAAVGLAGLFDGQTVAFVPGLDLLQVELVGRPRVLASEWDSSEGLPSLATLYRTRSLLWSRKEITVRFFLSWLNTELIAV